jgi:hypothetical protein
VLEAATGNRIEADRGGYSGTVGVSVLADRIGIRESLINFNRPKFTSSIASVCTIWAAGMSNRLIL